MRRAAGWRLRGRFPPRSCITSSSRCTPTSGSSGRIMSRADSLDSDDHHARLGSQMRRRDARSVPVGEMRVAVVAGCARWFKVSHQLYSAAGPDIIEWLNKEGRQVFLDFKYHDIYESVRSAVAQMAPHVSVLTLHGNGETIRGAIDGRGRHNLKLLAFTALSSFDGVDLREIYNWQGTVEQFMVRQALAAKEKGVDGVIASGREVEAVRTAVGPDFMIVTPGVRLEGAAVHDHKRTLGPGTAISAGSNYLVVGRPITTAPDARRAAEQFIE